VRIRLRYTKLGKIRFIGHRDLARIWERSIRRGGLPVAYTEGFSPRPKMAFGLALALGFESECEYLDVELLSDTVQGVPVELLPGILTDVLPNGMNVTAVEVLEGKQKSLQEAVTTCSWIVEVDADREQTAVWIERVLRADRIDVVRERKGRAVEDDLRPQVVALELTDSSADEPVRITAELGTKPRALRPTELLESLEAAPRAVRVRRTHQWISQDGDRYEPLLAVSAAQELCAT
jgi:radical SAM-linked protein